MGGPMLQGGGTPPPDGGIDFSSVTALLEQILNVLKYQINRGMKNGTIDLITLNAGATFQQIYSNSKPVTMALIQNISTENVTITSSISGSTASQGIILNKANAAGEGGGSMPVDNIDLKNLNFVRTTAGLTLAVYYEI